MLPFHSVTAESIEEEFSSFDASPVAECLALLGNGMHIEEIERPDPADPEERRSFRRLLAKSRPHAIDYLLSHPSGLSECQTEVVLSYPLICYLAGVIGVAELDLFNACGDVVPGLSRFCQYPGWECLISRASLADILSHLIEPNP